MRSKNSPFCSTSSASAGHVPAGRRCRRKTVDSKLRPISLGVALRFQTPFVQFALHSVLGEHFQDLHRLADSRCGQPCPLIKSPGGTLCSTMCADGKGLF